jgi:uncharacterized protein with HEPN domain
MTKNDLIFLYHMRENATLALTFVQGHDLESFLQNQQLRYACDLCIEIIGEAAKNVSEKLRKQHPEVEWKAAMGMRDKLVHDYFGVDYTMVWDTIHNYLPRFIDKIETIIAQVE